MRLLLAAIAIVGVSTALALTVSPLFYIGYPLGGIPLGAWLSAVTVYRDEERDSARAARRYRLRHREWM